MYFPSSFSIMAVYTCWYEVIMELSTALERDLAEIENELASIGGRFQG